MFRRTLAPVFVVGLMLSTPHVAAGQAKGPPAAPEGTVLFICEHGTVKSLLATLLFDEYAAEVGLPMRAISRGTAADSVVPPWMKAKLAENRLELGLWKPQALRPVDLSAASFVVSFDVPASASEGASGPRVRWDSLPPASQEFAASRDAIKVRVHALVDSLNRARNVRRPK